MELFRGESRIQLGKKLIGLVHARAHPVMLLQGGPGVGKTTVVNYGKEALRQSGEFFVYPKSIEISVNSTRETIAAEYLAAMTTAAMAQSPERNWEQDPRWKEAYETISEVWKTGGLGVSGSFAGFGVGVTLTQVQKVAEVMPWETWKALLENVLEALLEQRRGFLLHLNNIDAVSDENPEKAQELFDAIRDLLTVDGIHTILCASSSFLDEVLADRQRVLDVVELVDTVPELPPEEFLDAVHARYDYSMTQKVNSSTP